MTTFVCGPIYFTSTGIFKQEKPFSGKIKKQQKVSFLKKKLLLTIIIIISGTFVVVFNHTKYLYL